MERLCTGALLCLFCAGCPIPDVSVPDFTPAGGDLRTAQGDGTSAGQDDLGTGPGTWRADAPVPMPMNVKLRAVWAADAGLSRVYVVGHDGTIATRSGNGDWTIEPSGTKENLYAVLGTDGGDVYAVGGKSAAVILHRQGGKWSAEGTELKLSASLYGLTQVGDDLYAVGDAGTVVHRSGGAWKVEAAPMVADLRAVYARKADEIYAVGIGGAILRRSAAWARDDAVLSPSDTGDFYAVTAYGGAIYVAGADARVVRRDDMAKMWVAEPTVELIKADLAGAPADFYGLAGGTFGLLAVGMNGVAALRDQSMMWNKEATGTTYDLFGLYAAGPTALAVGDQGTVVRRY